MAYGEYYLGDGLDILLKKEDLATDKFDYLKGPMAKRVEEKFIDWVDNNLNGNEILKSSYRIKEDFFENNSKSYWSGSGVNTSAIISPFIEEEGYQICGLEELGEALTIPGLKAVNNSYTLGVIIRPEAPYELSFEQELRDMVESLGFNPNSHPVYIPARDLEARVDDNSATGVSVKLRKDASPRYLPSLHHRHHQEMFDELTFNGPIFDSSGQYQAMLADKGVTKVAFGGKKIWADSYKLSGINSKERILLKKKIIY